MCGEKCFIHGVHIPRQCIEFRHFYSSPPSHSILQGKFFENLFPPTAEKGGENYDLLYQNSIRQYEDDSRYHYVIYILHDL